MKRIGLLGGMSWESSVLYERLINEGVRDALGGGASADLIVRSYNFADIEALQATGRWDELGELLAADAKGLEAAGAELIVLCSNTMHKVAPSIEAVIGVPFIHLADATATAVMSAGVGRVGLLGTRFTMEEDFYRSRLVSHGLDVVVPDAADRDLVNRVIYDELVQGQVLPESKAAYLAVIDRLVAQGAEGIIAGCTEIELLIAASDLTVTYFPTTTLHAQATISASLTP